ncbi:MAG: hypothetical protein JNK84_02520 [Phreatobacter sp.]|uniref:hypothetical protein n=1 Tax=Phreatobacter sp. TaxID=1966341 RepID=UPI001A55482F|nr:hypothetical protein [Phreatobacter sp.]MBL8567936.1 hypothetical protein [Phreatobacter sp.]
MTQNLSRRLRLSMLAVSALGLSGCFGGGPVMTDFDSEKSRIRKALSSSIPCMERPGQGNTKDLICGAGSMRVTLTQEPGTLRFYAVYNDHGDSGRQLYAEFQKLMSAYEFTADDLSRCGSQRSSRRQLEGHIVSCTNASMMRGVDLNVSITSARRV